MRTVRALCLAAVASLHLTAAHADTPPPAALGALLNSIETRLNIADQVALSKWDSKKAVEDRTREREVIAGAVLFASEHRLEPAVVEQFFAAQIEANKLVQYGLLNEWGIAGKAPETPRPDLLKTIRPQLDALQAALIEQLATFAPERTNPQCPEWVAKAVAAKGLDELHRLALVRATGELCAVAH